MGSLVKKRTNMEAMMKNSSKTRAQKKLMPTKHVTTVDLMRMEM